MSRSPSSVVFFDVLDGDVFETGRKCRHRIVGLRRRGIGCRRIGPQAHRLRARRPYPPGQRVRSELRSPEAYRRLLPRRFHQHRYCAEDLRPPLLPRSSRGMVSSAISRSATTGFLSLSRSTVSSPPTDSSRDRWAAIMTSWNRLGIFRTQSSTVTRAISHFSPASGRAGYIRLQAVKSKQFKQLDHDRKAVSAGNPDRPAALPRAPRRRVL